MTTRIQGFSGLQRDMRALGKDIAKETRKTIAAAAEPIRADAEKLADQNIRNIGSRWDRMRIGVTVGGVYVAPKSRRRGGSPRPNLAPLLMEKAMVPAVAKRANEVVDTVEAMIALHAKEHGF